MANAWVSDIEPGDRIAVGDIGDTLAEQGIPRAEIAAAKFVTVQSAASVDEDFARIRGHLPQFGVVSFIVPQDVRLTILAT